MTSKAHSLNVCWFVKFISLSYVYSNNNDSSQVRQDLARPNNLIWFEFEGF